jgi:hypothetical protein
MRKISFGVCVYFIILCYSAVGQPYWVIETNVDHRNFTIIKFYNAQHRLLYEEKHLGVYFDLSKEKHKKRLDLMLENFLRSGSTVAKKGNRARTVDHFKR